jgi:hypothetical protein
VLGGGCWSRGDTRHPRAALSREEGTGAAGICDAPGAAPSPEVGAGAAVTRGTIGASLHREVGARSAETRCTPGAALRRMVGTGAAATRGGPGAALSREAGTTPPPPLSRPSARGQGVVVPIMPLDNPHQMITWGKTGFRVVLDRLVLTVATSSPTPCPIPSSAHVVLADPHWRAVMEDEYRAMISNGT